MTRRDLGADTEVPADPREQLFRRLDLLIARLYAVGRVFSGIVDLDAQPVVVRGRALCKCGEVRRDELYDGAVAGNGEVRACPPLIPAIHATVVGDHIRGAAAAPPGAVHREPV